MRQGPAAEPSTSPLTLPSHSIHNDLGFPARVRWKRHAGRNPGGLLEDDTMMAEVTADSPTRRMETGLKGTLGSAHWKVPE